MTTLQDLYSFVQSRMDPMEFKFVSHSGLNNIKKLHLKLMEFNINNKLLIVAPKYAKLNGGGFSKAKPAPKRKFTDIERTERRLDTYQRHNKKRRMEFEPFFIRSSKKGK